VTGTAILLAILLQLVLPMALVVLVVRRYNTGWKLFAFGALAFLLADMFRGPLWNAIASTEVYTRLILPNIVATILLYSLLVALLQQAFRYLSFRFTRSESSSWGGAMTLAVGSGGIELVMLYGMEVLIKAIFALQVSQSNGEGLGVDPSLLPDLLSQVARYWSRPFYIPLLEALPGLSGLALAFALTALMWMAVRQKSWLWGAAAVLWHTAFTALGSAASVWYSAAYPAGTENAYPSDAALAMLSFLAMGVVNVALLFWIRTRLAGKLPELPEEPAGPARKSIVDKFFDKFSGPAGAAATPAPKAGAEKDKAPKPASGSGKVAKLNKSK